MSRPNNWEDESYNNIKEDNRPYMDPYLKNMIEKAFNTFNNLKKGQTEVYFTGFWAADVMRCYPGRQSNKIFAKMQIALNRSDLQFFQKKLVGKYSDGFEYIVRKV
jgi:hypothetical protein|tara:strand:- start:1906 stop:2223 length:318 start_codon:yes stop_codon:yes gene_type:complete